MKITALVATYNEERHIGRCLTDLLQQRNLADNDLEILVIDGRSTDRTVDIVRSFPEFGSRIGLIENPRRLQVYAWNLGWHTAQGEYVAFIGAHTSYSPDYLAECLEAIHRTGAEAVGPVQVPSGTTLLGKAIAWCMTSRFGVGNARFRFTRREEEVDSVFSMFLRRKTLERMGGFDERVPFDEDGEFNYRLRAAGGRIVVSPRLGARYFVRNSFRALRGQMFCYGYWRRFTRILHPRRVPMRVYAPPALVVGLIASILLSLSPFWPFAFIVPLAYVGFVLLAVLNAVPAIGLFPALYVTLALPCMHVSYGAGFLRALMTPQQKILVGKFRQSAAP